MLSHELQGKLRHNSFVNIMDGALFGFGVSGLASYVTIIPLFLSYLTESTALIGFAAALFHIGWQVPQLLTWASRWPESFQNPPFWQMTLIRARAIFRLGIVALTLPVIGT